MGRQPEKRHIVPITAGDLSRELETLVEKRKLDDRRVKHRRGGPPRRSLAGSSTEAEETAGPIERRTGKDRRRGSTRRQKGRRKPG